MAENPNRGSPTREHRVTGRIGGTPLRRDPAAETESDPFAERPEAFVGAAFVGGFALAMILKKVVR